MSVGQRLKEARKEAGMSQEALGSLIGVTKGQISNIEKGTSQLTKSNAIVLSDKLNINVNWLLHDEGPKEKGIVQISGKAITFKENDVTGNNGSKFSVNFQSAQNENELNNKLAERFQEPKVETLPFIPVSARASFVDRFPDMNFQEMGSFPVYNLEPQLKKKNPVIIEVDGDSMEPQLRSKARVLAVPVDPGDWSYITGKVVAIVFDNQFTIKRISENTITREGGGIVLKADNGGATLAVPSSAIRQLWQVIKVIDLEVV